MQVHMGLKAIGVPPCSILAKPLDKRAVRRLVTASPQSARLHVCGTLIIRDIQQYQGCSSRARLT
jgi:hypothetical protein